MCFSAAGGAYCLPVEATRSVRLAQGMVWLVEARTDVAGVIAGDPPLTVIAPLGSGGNQILVVEAAGKTFGLLVDEVTGLVRVASSDIGAAPDGQGRDLICGTVVTDGRLVMLADQVAMAGRL